MALEQAWIFLKDDINDKSKCQECGVGIDPEDPRSAEWAYRLGLCWRCYDEMVQHTVAPDGDLHHAGILDARTADELSHEGDL